MTDSSAPPFDWVAAAAIATGGAVMLVSFVALGATIFSVIASAL